MAFEVAWGEEQISEHLMNLAGLNGVVKLCGVRMKRLVTNLSVVPPTFPVVHKAHVEVPSHAERKRRLKRACTICGYAQLHDGYAGSAGIPL
jgi:hypothetical protein